MRNVVPRFLIVAMAATAVAAPALAQGSSPSQAECAAAFAQATTNARAAVNDGILGGCGIAGTKIIAGVIRGSTQDVDQYHFMRLRGVTPRSGVVFEAALALAMNPAARSEARIGGMRLLARQLLGSEGDLLLRGGFAALARNSYSCSVGILVAGGGNKTGVEGDPLPADFEARVRTSMEWLALAPASDSIVQNGARCLRRYFTPPMIEPLPPASIHIAFVCGTQFRIMNSGTRQVVVTFEVAGRPGRTNVNAPVGDSFIAADHPGMVRVYYAGAPIDSATNGPVACRLRRASEPEVRRPCSPPDIITPALQQLALDIVSDSSAAWASFRAHHGIQASSASDVAILRSDRMCDAVTAAIERIGLPRVAEAYQTIQIGRSAPFYLAARREDFMRGGNVFLLNPRLEVVVRFGH